MKYKFLFIASLSFVISNAQDTAMATATMPNATVYFGYGAELVHQSKVNISSNTKIIIIDKLSTSVDVNSLQISCPESVALLSHSYSVFYPEPSSISKSKEYERLEDSITLLQKNTGLVDNKIVIEQEILTKTGTLIEAALSKGGGTGTDVLRLVEYYNTKIEKSKNAIYVFKEDIDRLNKRITVLKKKLAGLNVFPPDKLKPYGRLMLQVMSKTSGSIPVSLSYFTNNAGWTPIYDIRVNAKTNKVKLVYKASITQTTGIDWQQTKLTLSTGTPNVGVSAPVLTPWFLQLYVPELYKALQVRAAGVDVNRTRNVVQSFGDDKALAEVVVTSMGIERTDKKEDEDGATIDPSTLQQYTTLTEGQLNTNFEIDLPYDIDGDGRLHSVTIKDEEINCILKNYAVSRIDKDAYLLAEVADWQNLDLLPGDANIIMDETYIGKSILDPNTTSDTLNLSLGKDKRISVKRSLVKELSSIKTSGKENKQSFTYEIIVKNNKQTDVNLLVKDQYPLSTIKEIEVKLEDDGNAMVNAETGVLTWKLSLKPGEIRKLRFSYIIKHPKNKKPVNLK